MKKPRVTLETSFIYRIYVGEGKDRFIYAVTSDRQRAKKHVKDAEGEFGLKKAKKKK